MSAINPQKASQQNSTTAFITSLAVNASLLGLEVGLFVLLKSKLWRIYTPRAYLPPPDKRADKLPGGPWRWIPAVLTTPLEDIIHKNGLDAYMYLRFIKLLCTIFLVFTITTFLIVVPVDAAGIDSGLKGLEKISWSNIVDRRDQHRFSAHIIVVYALTAFVLWMIYREMNNFIKLRQQFLLSKSHTKLPQSRTVLITAIPDELSTEHDLRTFASFVPGGVDKVWMYRSTAGLNELFERRQEACEKLEDAISHLLTQATKVWRKKMKLHKKMQHKKRRDVEVPQECEVERPIPSLDLLNELVPLNRRPRHRIGTLGCVGDKVDSYDWCKKEIAETNEAIKIKRGEQVEGKFLGSAFIRCNLQMGAHILSQCLSYHEPMRMYDKWMEAHPKDIVWNNLDDGAFEMKTRYLLSWAATFGLIIAWSFPVAFIGTLSNLSELCTNVKWLAWVCRAPEIARGMIEGVLPPALLAVLFAVLPLVLKALAWYECIPRYSLMSVSVYRRFYFFLLVHGFLIVTISSGLTNAIGEIIKEPTKTVQSLASKLPGASVFFLTYMITQGLAGAGSALVQLVPLVLHYVKKWFLGRTPRQAYGVTFMMPAADFGVLLPRLSLLATITFAYSVLSPLINVLAFGSFGMFFLAWKFLLVQVFDQPDEAETGGMYFPMAVGNLFVGLYIEHLCLACLFFLRSSDEGAGAIVKGGFMLALLGITACVHVFMVHAFSPLYHYLPMSLATKKMAKKFEREKKRKEGVDTRDPEDDEIDLFSRHRIQSVRRRIQKKLKIKHQTVDLGLGKMEKPDVAIDERLKGRLSDSTVVSVSGPSTPFSKEGGHESIPLPEIKRQDTRDSTRSRASKKSKASSKRSRISFDEAAPRVSKVDDTDSDDEEEEDDTHAFDHPSTYQEQPWIWIPKDVLGLSEILAQDLRSGGVDASDVGAFMDEKGVVEVRRNPPDEEWTGGHDV
ncbi:DUF221-domain-containing protein [Coprinellus micaceus]|uniref:DUF221-domain-containing protein n=1 Tax=Coprinellus micaceus TaxID=71717 RepID=A0A4Y7TV53_COPMI|nr:DUF221-domain-containing protein [Coprinellus micaceus]